MQMKEEIVMFKKYLLEGYTQKKAAEMAGINPKNTTYYVKKYNLVVIKKYGFNRVNHEYFDVIDNETKAYLLGFFLADGFLVKNEIRINNSIDDLEIIELFRKEITPESKLIYSNKQTGAIFRKEQITVRLSSVNMSNTLTTKYDIIQNKTKHNTFKFNFNTIPVELHRHFIRGYFDGDGSVSFHNNNFNSIFFNFSFVFNSKYFTKQISDIFENLFQIKPVIYNCKGKTCDYFSLRFDYKRKRAKKIIEIYDYLYKESNVFLSRKKIKFEQYIEYRANPRRKEDRVV